MITLYVRTNRIIFYSTHLYANQHRSYLQRRRPLVLQNVQAYPPQLVDVRVVNFGQKPNLRRLHRVVFGEEELKLVRAALVGGARRARDLDLEIPGVRKY